MLDVIGAGFGRTGTNSLKLALEELGCGPCFHMFELRGQPERIAEWQAVADGQPRDWDQLLRGYRSAVDWPVAKYWRDLAAAYPQARIILTLRDPDDWYQSVLKTIVVGLDPLSDLSDDPVRAATRRMVRATVGLPVFGGRIRDRDHAISVYRAHLAEVRAEIPPARLLEFDVRDGWGPLAAFLGVPVPDKPYPKTNSSADFLARMTGGGSGSGKTSP